MDVRGPSEIRQLSSAFNRMTQQLNDQRERLIQAERVAAWRELARRLAHELNNPLFPLQTTVENLRRAKEMNSDQFEEVFRESTGILLAEIENSESHRRPLQRFLENAAAGIGVREFERCCSFRRQIVSKASSARSGGRRLLPELHLEEQLPVDSSGRGRCCAARSKISF